MSAIDFTTRHPCEHPTRILSVDGGGIRGVIPAHLLAEVEKQTEMATAKLFDLTAGTSIGSFVALGLSTPAPKNPTVPLVSARQVVEIFEKEASSIFDRSWLRTISSVDGLFYSKYSREGLDNVIDKYAGDALLSDSLTRVLVPSYEITSGTPWFFTREAARTKPEYKELKVSDVVKASSAAPTYFDPYEITSFKVNGLNPVFIDGGVSNNNPAIDAYFMARKLCTKPQNMVLCSLGTGHVTTKIPYSQIRRWGITQWATKIIDVCMDGVSSTVDRQLGLLNNQLLDGKRYYRYQTEVDAAHGALDDASSANIRYLEDLSKQIIENNEDNLREMCTLLERGASKERLSLSY